MKNIVKLLSAVIFIALCISSNALAIDSSTNAAQGLQISPTRVELNASKGGIYEIKLNVTNITAADLYYSSSVKDFNSGKNEDGSPNFYEDSSLSTNASIKTWVSNVDGFILGSHQSREISINVDVPLTAEPGGHYGAMFFAGSKPEVKNTGVGLSASTGVLILVRVDGDIKEQARLASFYTSQNDKQSFFFENGPITFVSRIQNEGNVHIKPTGVIELRDMFGGMVAKLDVNSGKSNVLPNSIRKFKANYDKHWMFGLYTADLRLGYGATGQAITNTISFWVIPYKLIGAGLLILATLFFIFSRMIKSYNKRIIEKAKRHESANRKSN